MNKIGYWKVRKILLNMIFRIKKIIYGGSCHRQSNKEYYPFRKILFTRFIFGLLEGLIIAFVLCSLDRFVAAKIEIMTIDNIIFPDVIIGELGVAGVILGLYCSNISSVYSSRYTSVPDEIATAFQHDRLTVKCMHSIISFIIYGSIILTELLLGRNVGLISGGGVIIWSLVVGKRQIIARI